MAAHTLSRTRTVKLAAAAAAFLARQTITYQGVAYQLDERSQGKITALGASAGDVLIGVPGADWPQDFAFIAADNSEVPFDAATLYAFAKACRNRTIDLQLGYRALKNAFLAAADELTLDAIDVNAG